MMCHENGPWELTMYGGYSYSVGDPETFATVREACEAWANRHASNGTRKVDGVYWPTWGDMADDDYAITTEADGLTRAQVLAVADGGQLPPGWGEHVFDTVRGRVNAARHCLYCQAISLDWDDVEDDEDDYIAACPACGQPIDYCQGHGEIGDPDSAAILAAHDAGEHASCHPDGCDEVDA